MMSTRHRRCINGKILLGDEVGVNLPKTALDTHFPDKEHVICRIAVDFNSVIPAGVGEMTSDQGLPGQFRVSGCPAKMLRTAITTAYNELFFPGLPPVNPRIAAAFEKTLLSMIAWVLSAAFDAGERSGRVSPAHRARLLRRTCEIIDEKLADDLTMQELCSIVGASRRTLENVFLESLGVSPYQYVRTIRLNFIRKELLAEENRGVSIGDIAAKCGVWHLSRFAQDYKRLFGHLPSEARRLAKLQ